MLEERQYVDSHPQVFWLIFLVICSVENCGVNFACYAFWSTFLDKFFQLSHTFGKFAKVWFVQQGNFFICENFIKYRFAKTYCTITASTMIFKIFWEMLILCLTLKNLSTQIFWSFLCAKISPLESFYPWQNFSE